jgi:hypothetical protein
MPCARALVLKAWNRAAEPELEPHPFGRAELDHNADPAEKNQVCLTWIEFKKTNSSETLKIFSHIFLYTEVLIIQKHKFFQFCVFKMFSMLFTSI